MSVYTYYNTKTGDLGIIFLRFPYLLLLHIFASCLAFGDDKESDRDNRLRGHFLLPLPMHARSLARKFGRKHIDLLDARWLCEQLGSFLHECRGDATGEMSLPT